MNDFTYCAEENCPFTNCVMNSINITNYGVLHSWVTKEEVPECPYNEKVQQKEESVMNMNDSERELCRSNYEAQMNMLGYNADGTPKEEKERHGEWIGPECSLCHAILERPIKYNYCPFCGANMT